MAPEPGRGPAGLPGPKPPPGARPARARPAQPGGPRRGPRTGRSVPTTPHGVEVEERVAPHEGVLGVVLQGLGDRCQHTPRQALSQQAVAGVVPVAAGAGAAATAAAEAAAPRRKA